MARISNGETPRSRIRWAMRWVSTRVLPEPAPAMTSSGPSSCTTASRWTGFSPRAGRSPRRGQASPSPYRRPPTGSGAHHPGRIHRSSPISPPSSRPLPTTGEMRALATKSLKRTAAVVVFLLVFNHLVVPQLGGARRALDLLSDVNPALLVVALALEIGAFAAYTQLTRVTLPPDVPGQPAHAVPHPAVDQGGHQPGARRQRGRRHARLPPADLGRRAARPTPASPWPPSGSARRWSST